MSKDVESVAEIRDELKKLMYNVAVLKRNGISMWNYKKAIPKIFNIVDSSFTVIDKLAIKVQENEDGVNELLNDLIQEKIEKIKKDEE
jgi:hypothetical protein